MNRRNFVEMMSLGMATTGGIGGFLARTCGSAGHLHSVQDRATISADVVIAGGGISGVAGALALLRNGHTVILTEETDWIGGQFTQQGLSCPDEHPWIASFGSTRLYRSFREKVRDWYRDHGSLTNAARKNQHLNPGDGWVSALCFEPRVALAVLLAMFEPYLASGHLRLLLQHKISGAEVAGNRIGLLRARNADGMEIFLAAPYFLEATETGDLLPLTGTEYVTGTESRSQTGELHAPEAGNASSIQAITFCMAMEYLAGENHLIDKPAQYEFWRNYIPRLSPPWPGRLLDLRYSNPSTLQPRQLGFAPDGNAGGLPNLWTYRRIIHRQNFRPGTSGGDVTIVNWPQNDFFLQDIIDVETKSYERHLEAARQLSLSLFYWLQTEVPRTDGGAGWPGLKLRPDIMGTSDGLAKYPYIREGRRIKAVFTVCEEHVGVENRTLVAGKKEARKAASFFDSVGVGYYHIDLHPTTAGSNYLDLDSLPFQIPLGALLPEKMENLVAAGKNMGTTHITNGCYRLHPVEWASGEAAGMVLSFALKKKIRPWEVRQKSLILTEFQDWIRSQGLETKWPENLK